MPYAYQTWTEARAALGRRLYDPDSVRYTDDEKTAYLTEALRTFNALTGYWRGDFILDLVQGTIWYDISSLTDAPNTLRPLTVTDNDLMTIMEYHLLEPPSGKSWTGSAQFSADDLLNAIQRRRDELVSSTTANVQRSTVPAVPGRTFTPDTVIDIRRICWLPVANPAGYVNTSLYKDDLFGLQSYDRDYTTAPQGTPGTYIQSTEPPLSFDVDVQPGVPGNYELLTVNAGPALSLIADTTLLVPDDFTWVIKFGALADLFSHDSNATDNLRAQYCNLRYQTGMLALLNASAILSARLTNLPLDIDSVQNADDYRAGWQSESQSTPDMLVVAGLNLVGFAATPDAGPNSATLFVTQNAPVDTTIPIQIGRDDYDVVLDYAQHLGLLKEGGQEFMATMPLLERFLKRCTVYNSKLSVLGEYMQPMYDLAQSQSRTNPVFNDPAIVGEQPNANTGQ